MPVRLEKPSLAARAILCLLFIFQFLISFRPQELAWDGIYYYATARSILFDGDLHLQNDLRLAYPITPAQDFAATHPENDLTPTGRIYNPFAVGTSILWLPWMALIYGAALLGNGIGIAPTTMTGYEWPFLWGAAIATCLYGWTAIAVAYRLARKLTGERAALLAAATVVFSTPLWYYQFREPFYAHPASAMATALFVFAWWHADSPPPRPIRAFLLGSLGGLSALIRWQNATYLILPAVTIGFKVVTAWRKRDSSTLSRSLLALLSTLSGAALVVSLQLAVWIVFYGRPLLIPQGGAFMEGRAIWLGHVLLSPFHGLMPWMPLVIPALAGLILLARQAPDRGIPLLIAFTLQIYVNSCIVDWFGGGGYGARRFTNTLVILLVGYAYLIHRSGTRWRVPILLLSGFLVIHQFLLIRYGFLDRVGGYVISMAPEYAWRAESLLTFLQRLASYIPGGLTRPLEALILPGSPLAILHNNSPAVVRQILLLSVESSLAIALAAGGRRLVNRFDQRRISFFLVGLVVILVVIADVWILQCL